MASLREFLVSINRNVPEVSVLEVSEHCQAESPVSLKMLIQGGCRRTISVALERQLIQEGNVPYVGTLNERGILQEVAVPASTSISEVRFVKAGRSTDECNDREAVIIVPSGDRIGQEEIAEIFGFDVSEPQSPVAFNACVASSSSQIINFVFIEVTITPF